MPVGEAEGGQAARGGQPEDVRPAGGGNRLADLVHLPAIDVAAARPAALAQAAGAEGEEAVPLPRGFVLEAMRPAGVMISYGVQFRVSAVAARACVCRRRGWTVSWLASGNGITCCTSSSRRLSTLYGVRRTQRTSRP